jgi:Phosphotransferase enzyme family
MPLFSKVIKPHSRLNLDLAWSEFAMARIAENSWRVLLKPHLSAKGVYLYHDESQFKCHFEQFDSNTLWTTYGTDNGLVYESHLGILPMLLRDLTDSSDGIAMSSAHRNLWRETASRSVSQLETFNLPGQTPEISAVIRRSLRSVIDCDIPEEVLVHGDFHPGNVLVRKSESRLEMRVCDLENLTVGSAFVDALYCAVWAQFLEDSTAFWNLLSYLEHKHSRCLSEVDLGLCATLMMIQAAANSKRVRNRILGGLFWLTRELSQPGERQRFKN